MKSSICGELIRLMQAHGRKAVAGPFLAEIPMRKLISGEDELDGIQTRNLQTPRDQTLLPLNHDGYLLPRS